MRAVDIIRKKRDGLELSRAELAFMIRGFCNQTVPDYQLAALMMAVVFRGMTDREVTALTEEMRISGDVVDLSAVPGRKVDKHSTGGVGDKTSMVVAPAVAALGVAVPMIAGRGLGHTGGTLDKLESIPGFNVNLSLDRFRELVSTKRLAFIGQTESLVPADRRLYALRDVTATVDSPPLISASIMSKKLAEGIDGLVLDVKTGSGAFVKKPEAAESLARGMVRLGRSCGKNVVALLTDMSQPLGDYAGNAHEIFECIETLNGRGSPDVTALCEELSAHCLVLGEAAADPAEGRRLYRSVVASGKALERFREIIELQGGDARVTDDPQRLPQARYRAEVTAPVGGYIGSMDTEKIGLSLCVLGAGRETLASAIDPAVGMRFYKKVGDPVEAGEPICLIYYNDDQRYHEARSQLLEAYTFTQEQGPRPTLIQKCIVGHS